jgi:HNH endonuclease
VSRRADKGFEEAASRLSDAEQRRAYAMALWFGVIATGVLVVFDRGVSQWWQWLILIPLFFVIFSGLGAIVVIRTWGFFRGLSGTAVDTGPFRREAIPERVRHEVWRRDQGRCASCGGRDRLEFDHIVPVSRGGSNTARNVELLCERCNRSKGARI